MPRHLGYNQTYALEHYQYSKHGTKFKLQSIVSLLGI